jgi:casein kinase II subunit alpha
VPKYYADACSREKVPAHYCEPRYHKLRYGDESKYTKLDDGFLGEGTFSQVYKAQINNRGNTPCVIKYMKGHVPNIKLRTEMKILENLRGGPNILKMYETLKIKESNEVAIVTEFVNTRGHHPRDLYDSFSDLDVQYYMYELLKAVDFTHSKGVMHRDIKPGNIMIDPIKRKLTLIDFGCSEFYFHGREYTLSVGTRSFRAPE